MPKIKCDYCNRKPITWTSYEGIHMVCGKHKKVIEQLAKRHLVGVAFLEAIEKFYSKQGRSHLS